MMVHLSRAPSGQVSPQGAGHILKMNVPLVTATATIFGKNYTLDGSVAEVEVVLNFLPSSAPPPGPDVAKKDLKVMTTPKGKEAAAKVHLEFAEGREPEGVAKYIAQGVLEEWFNKNLAAFNHVFAVISVNEAVAKGDFAWMLPHDQAYANASAGDSAGVFAVLAMTGARPQQSPVLRLSIRHPQGANIGSADLFTALSCGSRGAGHACSLQGRQNG